MKLSDYRRTAAFLLSEVMVSLAIFGITAGVSMLALTHMNNRAYLSRCQTGASTVCQNQVDLILSDMPFNPQKSQIPPELTIGTTNAGSASNPTLPIYTDPKTGIVSVYGWMTTVVANTSQTYSTTTLYIYRASVTVSYKFKGKTYSVVMNTMRCSDL